MIARECFGPALKAQRERQGITLEAIAASTKISVSILAALERNDVSRWPKGIFRRAFFREYAAAIGVPPEPLVADFVRLFPEDPYPEAADANELRLTLERDPRAGRAAARTRVLVALLEVSGVLLLGAIAAWVLNADLWTTSGIIALVYYPLANVCVERTPRLRSLDGVAIRHASEMLHAFTGAVRRLHAIWWRPTPLSRLPQDADHGTSQSAPEWRPASN